MTLDASPGEIACPICGGPVEVVFSDLYDDRYGYPGRHSLLGCRRCGHKSLATSFTEAELVDLYGEYYPRGELKLEGFRPKVELRRFRPVARGRIRVGIPMGAEGRQRPRHRLRLRPDAGLSRGARMRRPWHRRRREPAPRRRSVRAERSRRALPRRGLRARPVRLRHTRPGHRTRRRPATLPARRRDGPSSPAARRSCRRRIRTATSVASSAAGGSTGTSRTISSNSRNGR